MGWRLASHPAFGHHHRFGPGLVPRACGEVDEIRAEKWPDPTVRPAETLSIPRATVGQLHRSSLKSLPRGISYCIPAEDFVRQPGGKVSRPFRPRWRALRVPGAILFLQKPQVGKIRPMQDFPRGDTGPPTLKTVEGPPTPPPDLYHESKVHSSDSHRRLYVCVRGHFGP